MLVCAAAIGAAPVNAQTAKPQKSAAGTPAAKADKHVQAPKSGQAIVVLVNDEPITAYEIEQRAAFIGVSAGGGGADMKAKAEARWAQIVKDPKTNERFQQLLRDKNVKSQAEAQAIQAQYVKNLQHEMLEQLRREARAGATAGSRHTAQEELIEEKLKLQEAKKLGIDVSEDEAKAVLKSIAERNKMNPEQFAQHVKGMGVDINTMRDKYKAQFAWREVIRRKFGAQIAVTDREVDRMVSANASDAGEDSVELQLQKITLRSAASLDQAAMTKRYAQAEQLRRKFSGCKTMASLAKDVPDAAFDDMKFVKPSAITEPTRSMLLSAKDGDMLPPGTGAHGVEIYAVCGRRAIKGDSKQREQVQAELQQKEFELLARRHLLDLRQDAHIELR